MTGILDFINALQYTWLQRAMISAILIGIVCSIIGVFIILRGMIFLGEALAHSAFAGAALAILLGYNDPIFMIIAFGLITALGVNYVNEKEIMKDEIIIGISFTFFMALAVLFIGLMKSYTSSVQSILFGRILLITTRNFVLLWITTFLVVGSILSLKKEFYFITFNESLARTSGIPVTPLNYFFMILVALSIDVSITAIGAILVFAMLVIPAAAAFQWTYEMNRMLIISPIFGILSTVGGLYVSFIYNLPSGATIVLLSTGIFAISFIISPKRRLIKNELRTQLKDDESGQRGPHFHLAREQSTDAFEKHMREKSLQVEEKS